MKRRAQGAIEYLLMIAAALIIIALVLKRMKSPANEASKLAKEKATEINQSLQNLNSTAGS